MQNIAVLGSGESAVLGQKAEGGFLPRLVRAALRASAGWKARRALALASSGNAEAELDEELWQAERRQRFDDLHSKVALALTGYSTDPVNGLGH